MPCKVTLLLDLDETTFIALNESEFELYGHTFESIKALKHIHHRQILSNYRFSCGYYFFVINPERLKAMIEAIYKNKDEIVIFTSGLWLKPILSIVSELCDLSLEASTHFKRSLFLNPQHDSKQLDLPQHRIATLFKAYRLHGLFRSMPELRSKHFVLLDNDRHHIASCETSYYLDGVVAATDTEDLTFYDTALKKMELAHAEETRCSPSSSCYFYPEAILRAYIQMARQQEQEEQSRVRPGIK